MTAVREPDAEHEARGLFDAYLPYVDQPESVAERMTALQPVHNPEAPVRTEVGDVVDRSALTIVDYRSITTVGVPVISETHGVAWYVGQRGLSYFPLITGTPLSVHSFDWSSSAMETPNFPTVQVSAVVIAGCGTPCIPLADNERLPSDKPIAYCTDPRCWKQPAPTPAHSADQQTEI